MQVSLLSWLLLGGSVSIPKRLFAVLDCLGMDLNDVGSLAYLMHLEGMVSPKDIIGYQAARSLSAKGIIEWDEPTGRYSLEPLFKQMSVTSEITSENISEVTTRFTLLLKKIERAGRFPSESDKAILNRIVMENRWSIDLIERIYIFYIDEMRKRRYTFLSYVHELQKASVNDNESFDQFVETMNWQSKKVGDVLRRLGKYNNPSEPQKEIYSRWQNKWHFSHELILLATDETLNADNPNMSYVNQVLKSWFEAGIKTPKDVASWKKERERQKNKFKTENKTKRELKNKNFTSERRRSLNHLEE